MSDSHNSPIAHSALCAATFNNYANGACDCKGIVPGYVEIAHLPNCACGRCKYIPSMSGGQWLVKEELL